MKSADLIQGQVYAVKNGYVRRSGPTSMSDIRAMRFEGKGTAEVDVGVRYPRVKHREGLTFVQVNDKGRKVQGAQLRLVKPQEVYGLYADVVKQIEERQAARERAREEKAAHQAEVDKRVERLNAAVDKLDVRAMVVSTWRSGNIEIRLYDLEAADKLADILEAVEMAKEIV